MQIFRGIPRKIAIGTLSLTAVGWFMAVVGFGIATVQEGFPRNDPLVFPHWATVIGGPFAIIIAVSHAAIHDQPFSQVLGSITAFLGTFFVASLGMYLYFTGSTIRALNEISDDLLHSTNLQFAGSLFAILFWTATMILAVFYDFGQDDEEYK